MKWPWGKKEVEPVTSPERLAEEDAYRLAVYAAGLPACRSVMACHACGYRGTFKRKLIGGERRVFYGYIAAMPYWVPWRKDAHYIEVACPECGWATRERPKWNNGVPPPPLPPPNLLIHQTRGIVGYV